MPWKKRPIEDRFWEHVEKGEECWLWKGAKNEQGYGTISYKGKLWLVHRISWLLEFGDIRPFIQIRHTCLNRSCVRPSHLVEKRIRR